MIVFDLDDTLYKEVEYIDSGIRAISIDAEEAGIISASLAYDLVKSAPDVASGFDRLAAYALQSGTSEVFDIQRILAVYRNHIPVISLPADSLWLMGTLKSENKTMGLITDGRSIAQRAKIKALGLDFYISSDNILISQEVGADKRWPTAFEEIMRRNPEEDSFVYVGDNPEKDFLWPNRLGWQTVMLLDIDNTNIHPQSTDVIPRDNEYNARHSIKRLSELPSLLQSLK